jgi:hypothetical protein
VTAQANPMRTDATGEFSFYAADGVYSITLAKNGHTARTISGVALLDGARVQAPVADYAALRSYAGGATSVFVLASGIAGTFVRDATVTVDNGGTQIVGVFGWKRVFDGPVDVRWFGFSAAGAAAANTAAVHAAVASMGQGSALLIPPGDFACDPLTLDLPSDATLICYGRFVVAQSGASPAVTLGNAAVLRMRYQVHGLRVTSDAAEGAWTATAGSVGVMVVNVSASNLDIQDVYGYETGCLYKGDNAIGCALNQTRFGRLRNNKYTLRLTAAGGGYCTSSLFIGGSYQHGSNMVTQVGAEHLILDNVAPYPVEHIRFVQPILEASPAGVSKCGTIHGARITVEDPRIEGPTALELTVNSFECEMIGPYFDYTPPIDAGGTNNVIGTKSQFYRGRRTDGFGVLNLHNAGGNTHPLLTFMGGASPGTVNGQIDGNAYAQLLALKIGASGTKITSYLRGSRAIDFPSIANGTATSDTVTVTGASSGTNNLPVVSSTVALPAGVFLVGQVTAASTVTVQLVNLSGAAYDAPSMTIHVAVWQH